MALGPAILLQEPLKTLLGEVKSTATSEKAPPVPILPPNGTTTIARHDQLNPTSSLSFCSLRSSMPSDLGTLGAGTPLFPMTDLQAPDCLIALLDPMARTLRSMREVLKVLNVYILTLLKCRLLNRVPLFSGRRATSEQGFTDWVRTPLLITRLSPRKQATFIAVGRLKCLFALLLQRRAE